MQLSFSSKACPIHLSFTTWVFPIFLSHHITLHHIQIHVYTYWQIYIHTNIELIKAQYSRCVYLFLRRPARWVYFFLRRFARYFHHITRHTSHHIHNISNIFKYIQHITYITHPIYSSTYITSHHITKTTTYGGAPSWELYHIQSLSRCVYRASQNTTQHKTKQSTHLHMLKNSKNWKGLLGGFLVFRLGEYKDLKDLPIVSPRASMEAVLQGDLKKRGLLLLLYW